MKPFTKRVIGHFGVLIDHALREREPSPEHVLHRMVLPLCRDFSEALAKSTKNDAWDMLEGLSKECQRLGARLRDE